jgi:hypothetical protein
MILMTSISPAWQFIGQHCGHEQLADGLLREDGVDDQRHRGRDHDAQRASGGERPGGQGARVAKALELGQCHLPHGGGRGQGGTANGTEASAGTDRSHGHAALHVAHECFHELEERSAQTPVRRKLAHEQEQRDDHDVVVGQARVAQVFEVIEDGRGFHAREVEVPRCTHGEHGDADGHADDQQHHQAGKNDAANCNAAHACAPPVAVLWRKCTPTM